MKIEVVVASEKHLSYVTAINDAIDQAAKARGTGIARRTDEYIADKIRNGKAIIALNREEFVGFCYIESWGHQKFVANSGLIVVPAYRVWVRINSDNHLIIRVFCFYRAY